MKFKDSHIDEFVGLIVHVASKHHKTNAISHYDLIQAGYLGLAQAIKTYKKGKSPLKNWAYRFISSSIIKANYKNGKPRPEVELDPEFDHFTDDTSPITFINEVEDIQEDKNKIKDIYKVLENKDYVTELNKEIFLDRHIKGMKCQDIADEHGLTYSAVIHRLKDTGDKVRRILNEQE